LIIFALIYLAIGVLLIVGVTQRRSKRLQALCINLLITYSVIALLFGAGELFFRYAYAESDGLPTLAVGIWLDRYWHENSLGYRDHEWTSINWEGKTTIIAVGDSLTAGWGIENAQDRWTGVLAERLGDNYAVINIGQPATTTIEQIENLRAFPLQNPDHVIWQYTLNDIENAALSIGLQPDLDPLAAVPAWAQDSYLGNFVYWRLAPREARGGDTYAAWLHNMYDHSVVWEIHAEQINTAIDQVESMEADLIPLIFPDMPAPFNSIAYVDRVASVFESRGYVAIKLFDAAEAMPLDQRVVSPRDAHPSAAFSRVVADIIYEQFFAEDATDGS
jgi:lysophospholipase L1-like esterase